MESSFGSSSVTPASPSLANFHFVKELASQVTQAAESCADMLQQYVSEAPIVPLIGAVGAISLGAAAVYFSSGGPSQVTLKIEPVVDLSSQSVVVSDDGARVSRMVGEEKNLQQRLFDDARTLYEGFRRGARMSQNGPCVGSRESVINGNKADPGPYKWLSYDDVIRRSENLARGFVTKKLAPGQGSFIGIYAQNRPEWIITEQACYYYSMIIVPLYDTLGPDVCSYIIDHTEMQLVIVDKSSKGEDLLHKHEQCPSLRILVVMDEPAESLKKLGTEKGVEIITFSQLEEEGAAAVGQTPVASPPRSEDLCTIAYTSGTTGVPKGVMLTHGNVVADCTGLAVFKYSVIDSNDVMVSFLPLAHMFERLMEAVVFSVGGRVGFYRGDIRTLGEDIKELRPTLMPVVPRLLNRVYDKVMQEASKSVVKKFMIDMAVKAKREDLKRSIIRNNTIWDKIVFKRIRDGMGGRVRLMICGSAPLSEEVLTFMRAALGCIVLEGYGQTECVAPCTVSLEGDHLPGHVGPPFPCCKIKLVDVPDMNYNSREGCGEVCVKGYNVFKGYYKDAEKTSEALDKDGWLHTGDIGRWTDTGTLKLVDRKKHIFKLAQGEYIAPEKIETIYARSRFVGQIYVHGESLKSCLVAIVSPDADVLVPYVEKQLNIKGTMEELCKNEKVKQLIMKDMVVEGKKGGLQSFEQVKDIYLYCQPFTVEAGLLTPTMKSKRGALKDYFQEQIAQMYIKLI